MSLKTLLRIFTAFSVVVSGYPQDETDCVTFIKNNKFPYNFLSELSLKRNQSVWENITRSITKFTNICLLKKNVSGCTRPVINIYFPVISQKPKIALKVLPRPYLATKDTSPNMANQVVSSLGHVWKLFVICLIAAAISGLMIWFLDHKANSGHFPKSFWRGTAGGLWWAIVTMTTVGYGDKTPKSFLGRVYASLWMFIGMLLMSSFTAQISSTMTTESLRPLDEHFGHKIGIPYGSSKFFRGFCEGAELKEYHRKDNLLTDLQDGKVEKIWLFHCDIDQDIRIVYFFPGKSVLGADVELIEYRRNLQKYFFECLDQWAKEEHESCHEEQVASKILNKRKLQCKKPQKLSRHRCIEKHSRVLKDPDARKSPHMKLIDILLCVAGGLLFTLLATGALWDSCLKLRQNKKPSDNAIDIELAMAVGTQELQPRMVILKREESATGFPPTSSVLQSP